MRIMQGDCLRIMPALPDASIDLILADLPYGTTRNKWDAVIPFAPLWAEYKRIIKPNGAIVLFGAQPFTSALTMSNPAWFKYAWVWEKSSVTGHLNAHKRPMRKHEDILVFARKTAPYYPQGLKPYNKINRRSTNGSNFGVSGTENFQAFTNYPRSILRFDNDTRPVHPTQKPVALLEYLIRTYTEPGAVVLDNVMGSGSTGVAAFNTGRKFLGIEQDAGYFEIARKRLADAGAPVTVVYELPESELAQWANA